MLFGLGTASAGLAQVTSSPSAINQLTEPNHPISTRAADLQREVFADVTLPSSEMPDLEPPLAEAAIAQTESPAPSIHQSTNSTEPTVRPVEQGVRVPPSLNEGVEIGRIFIYLRNPTDNGSQNDLLKQQIEDAFGLRAGGSFSSLFAEKGINQVEQLPFVQTAEYRLYEAETPGRVIVAVLVTLQPQEPEPEQPIKKPSGILVNGDFSQFPTLYVSDRALVKTILNAGFGVFSDTNSWFGSTSDFVRGSYQPRGTITWPELYVEAAILDMRMILIKTSGFNVYEWLKPAFCRL
ncbi:MAG TPA: hypothetical protein IGS53_22045 [Leptolyngbyaceae cyanobacterium M33_DOE_097]|uniref:Uncharacterized protein n=1 Tax=Oscillatoriales cyanobacterium SpSt-418 TaxID=2282169 RepID=A0A7C3KHK1_9CYAN|nr:hypothetical protein [Leptolyngbyaceae cyanobacterium M33_DOE_097]